MILRVIGLVFSAIAILLGGLWLLQGLGLVQLRPILCFADCEPIQGASTIWAIVGTVMLAAGALGLGWAWRRLAAASRLKRHELP